MSARNFLFLCAATIPASFGLLQDGFFSSSDGMIHLYRLFELDRAIQVGIFYPRWFPLSGFGYGLPVLNYYPPLSYYLAEIPHLFGAGYIISIKLLIASGFVLAALSMFLSQRSARTAPDLSRYIVRISSISSVGCLHPRQFSEFSQWASSHSRSSHSAAGSRPRIKNT
jgi:uncharacterized membrane protein